MLPAKGYPIAFYGVNGEQRYEEEGLKAKDGKTAAGARNAAASLVNPQEAATVVHLVMELVRHRSPEEMKETNQQVPPVGTNELGVVATFRKQVYLIRQMFRDKGLGNVRVGTVDDYQGQEERVLLVSTVVSRVGWLRPEVHLRADSQPGAQGGGAAGGQAAGQAQQSLAGDLV